AAVVDDSGDARVGHAPLEIHVVDRNVPRAGLPERVSVRRDRRSLYDQGSRQGHGHEDLIALVGGERAGHPRQEGGGEGSERDPGHTAHGRAHLRVRYQLTTLEWPPPDTRREQATGVLAASIQGTLAPPLGRLERAGRPG